MTGKKEFSPTTIPAIVSIAMLLSGIPKGLPYGYYALLRLVVCGTGAYIAFFSYQKQKKNIMYAAGFIAVLYNPFIPIHLSRETWVIINFVTAVFLAISIFALRGLGVDGENRGRW